MINKKKETYIIEEVGEKKGTKLNIREVIGKNLISIAVTFVILVLLIPLISREIVIMVWELSNDEDILPFIYVDSGKPIINLVGEVVINTLIYPFYNTMIKIVKFMFLLILIVIILYCFIHLVVNTFIQTNIKIRYTLLINGISAIVTIDVCFYSIPYMADFADFINEMANKSLDPMNISDSILELVFIIWDYALKMYKPVLFCVFMMFMMTTVLYIVFRNLIVIGAGKNKKINKGGMNEEI